MTDHDTSPSVEVGALVRTRNGKSFYQAKRRADGRPLLVMRMSAPLRQDPAAEKRIRREFAAARKVDSPYVMRYLALLSDGKAGPVLVMEPEKGITLRTHLAMHGKLDYDGAYLLMRQMSQGLLACHRAGVVHRDVSPETVRISDEGAQLTEFGLSYFQQATALTLTGTMLQSPEYAPPETFVGTSHDLRCDVYSAGIVFWEALVGRSPFEGQTLAELLVSKKAPVPAVSAVEPACPGWLDSLLAAMTAPDPDARPASFAEVLETLESGTFLRPAPAPTQGCCMRCGHGLLQRAAFCVACGEDRPAGTKPGDVTLLLTNVGDVETTASLLKATFSRKPLAPLHDTLRKRRVYLGTNFSHDEAAWLAERLNEQGAAVTIEPPYRVFEHLAWFFAGVLLFVALLIEATLETSWSLNVPTYLSRAPAGYQPFINQINLVTALVLIGLYLTLGQYKLTLDALFNYWWLSVVGASRAGYKVFGFSLPGVFSLASRAALAALFAWIAAGAVIQICSAIGTDPPPLLLFNMLEMPIALLAVVWFLSGKAAEPVLFDRRSAEKAPMLPAAEFELWRGLQASLQAARHGTFGNVSAVAAEAFASGAANNVAGIAADECLTVLREGLLTVTRKGHAITALRKAGATEQSFEIHEHLNEARRATGLMRTALLRFQRLSADRTSGEEAARSLAELRLELTAMAKTTV